MTAEREALRADALDFVVRLLFDLRDAAADSAPFHDRICEAVCELTSLERAVLFLYDPDRRLVVPAGSHGVDPEILAHTYGGIEETPIAREALMSDEVVVVDRLAGNVPDRYAELPTLAGVSCTPVAAGGRWLGVIFADRNGAELDLDADERRTMRALGRTAALRDHRAPGGRAARARRAAAGADRARARGARERHAAALRRLDGARLGPRAERRRREADRGRARGGAGGAARARSTARSSRPPSPRGRRCAASCSGSAASTRRCR